MNFPQLKLATVLYGSSDDRIEVEGEQYGEVSAFAPTALELLVRTAAGDPHSVFVTFDERGAWRLSPAAALLEEGAVLDPLPQDWTPHMEEEVGYSDLLHLPAGWRVYEEGEETPLS